MENKKFFSKISVRVLLSMVLITGTFYFAHLIRKKAGETFFYHGLLIGSSFVLLRIWNFTGWVRRYKAKQLSKKEEENKPSE